MEKVTPTGRGCKWKPSWGPNQDTYVNVNVNDLLSTSKQDIDHSGAPLAGPRRKATHMHVEATYAIYRASRRA